MKAYSQSVSKAEFVSELKKHQRADDFVRGSYWVKSTGKGCAVGCSLESVAQLKGLRLIPGSLISWFVKWVYEL